MYRNFCCINYNLPIQLLANVLLVEVNSSDPEFAVKTFAVLIKDKVMCVINLGTFVDIIKYLHERNIVHRDIRIPNVIIDEEKVYLIDFGLARLINNGRHTPDADFTRLDHFLLHLYYSSFKKTNRKSKPWYNELQLSIAELKFLKRLLGLDDVYTSIYDVERDFLELEIVAYKNS